MKNVSLLVGSLVLFSSLVGCSAVQQYVEYAGDNPYGTIEGHPVYYRESKVINGKVCHVAYVELKNHKNERGEKVPALRAYYLPKGSPMYIKVHEEPADRSANFTRDVTVKLEKMVSEKQAQEAAQAQQVQQQNLSKLSYEEILDEVMRRRKELDKEMQQSAKP